MSIILGSDGLKSRAFSIDGVTCAVMLRRPFVDPCHLREMRLTVLVDREGRIAISHAGVVDPLVFEADINALLAESVSLSAYFAHRCEFVPISRLRGDMGISSSKL